MIRNLAGNASRPVVITGGAGFIGANLAGRLAGMGRPVWIYDNLARPGVEQNAAWLEEQYPGLVHLIHGDVRDQGMLREVLRDADQVFHFAAQVAVTTSLDEPRHDFDVNVVGTLNVLETLRSLGTRAPLVYTSTNKVYGGLRDVELRENGTRYEPVDPQIRRYGISEDRGLDFYTPYGCSKGSAEQYVLDYARTFGQPAVVFRMSCIYGPHQFGTEDQGWVAHFLIQMLEENPLTLYGDGKQVRDVLFAEDLVDAFLLAQLHMPRLSGQAFNIGGGPSRTISLVELLSILSTIHGERPRVRYAPWRPGDQRYYVSDTRKFANATGWSPKRDVPDGIEQLYQWLLTTRSLAAPASAGKVGR